MALVSREKFQEFSPMNLWDFSKEVYKPAANLLNHANNFKERVDRYEHNEKVETLSPKEFKELMADIKLNLGVIRGQLEKNMPEQVKLEISEHVDGLHERAQKFGVSLKNHKWNNAPIKEVFKNEAAFSAALVGYLKELHENRKTYFRN